MRVGSICFCTEQGIGFLPKWFYDAGVITDVMLLRHGSRLDHFEWYPPETPHLDARQRPWRGADINEFIDRIDVLLQFETPFDWSLFDHVRSRGKRSALVPMYECYPKRADSLPDKFICPSLLDQRDYWPGSPFLEVPVPPDVRWHQRTRARRFLHNGGNLGLRGHKGTLEIMQAMNFVKSDIRLSIRAQDTRGFKALVDHCPQIAKDERVLLMGDVDRLLLFHSSHDVFIMAEKYNGLSLPLREARAAGMLVMTSDRFPMNTWLPQWPLIPVSHYATASVGGPYNDYLEATVTPEDIAAKIDEVYDADITQYSLDGRAWGEQMSWERLRPLWLEELAR